MGEFFMDIIQISLISMTLMIYGIIHHAAITCSAKESRMKGLFARQVWIIAGPSAFTFLVF
jgi:hypothetical protein